MNNDEWVAKLEAALQRRDNRTRRATLLNVAEGIRRGVEEAEAEAPLEPRNAASVALLSVAKALKDQAESLDA